MYHNLIVPVPKGKSLIPAMGLSPGFETKEEARSMLQENGWEKIPTRRDMPELYAKGGQLATILSEIDSPAIYE